jgi:uncharacterized repeat protein (TIGR01451 family)
MTESETSRNGVVRILVPIGIVLAAIVGLALVAYGLNLLGPPETRAVAVRIEASPSPTSARPGDVVTYVVTISNEAPQSAVEIRSVSDTLLGDLSAAFPSRLPANGSEQETFMRTVRAGDPDPLRNTVTVSVTAGDEVIDATTTAEVDVLTPAVRVQASLTPESAAPGEEIVYSVSLSNVGEATLAPITVTDSLDGDLSASFPSGLPPGVSQGQAFDWAIPSDARDSITRTITVYAGTAGTIVSDTTTVALDLTRPAVRVEAAVEPPAAVPGETVTYTISLVNAGRVPLRVVTVTDSLQGDLMPSFPSSLTVGTSREQTFDWAIPRNELLPLTRTVMVRAQGAGGVVSATATAVVDLLKPVLRVETAVMPTATVRGGAATYTLTVVNGGQLDLRAVRVEDSFLGDVSRAFPNSLPAGMFHSQAYTWSSRPDDVGPLIRSVTASGEGAGQVVSDTATAALNLAGVAVSVAGPERVEVGEQVSVTLKVTNTGSAGAPSLVLEAMADAGRELTVPEACQDLVAGEACSFSYDLAVPSGVETFNTDVEARYRLEGGTQVAVASAEHTLTVTATTWQQGTGMPDGAEFRALAVCPADPDVLYAGFGNRRGGIYRSMDGGATWEPTTLADEDTEVFGIAVDPEDCDMVYAGAWRDGVRTSEDGGRTWSASTAGLDGAFVYSVAVDPTDGDIVYAGTAERGVYRSTDAGATWRDWGPDALTVPYLSVASDGRTVYGATWGDGIYRRERSGVGWRVWDAVNRGFADEHQDVYAVVVDPADPSTVFAATASGGVYRTRESGRIWEQVLPAPRTAYAVAVAPPLGGTVYAGTADGIYRSGAKGDPGSWEPFGAGLEELAIRSLALGPEGMVHVGTSNGAWRRLP